MGRPPLENAKTSFVGIRISAAERKALSKAAKAAGLSLSAQIMAPHRKGRK